VQVLNYLELAGPLERSGIATATRQQRAALTERGVEVMTSPWGDGGAVSKAAAAATGRVVGRADVAHCHLFGPASVLVARHARRLDVPLVLHAHTLRENTTGSWRGAESIAGPLERYLRWFYSQADLVLAPSEWAIERLREYPVDVPMRAITNGVDLDALAGFEDLRAPYRERYGLGADDLVVFAVGNVFERKGLSTFCELARATDYDFVWFGPYDRGPHASREVRRWTGNPPDNVRFTGWVDDVRGAYAAGDVYLFPTRSETQGLTALEAMACGKPVVLRDLPVFREYFEDGEDCLMCEGFDEFEAAIDRLADDPALRRRLGENARETAESHSLARVGERLESIYSGLV
jgi:glycosyltransferase involved in cell wall biosynthesis